MDKKILETKINEIYNLMHILEKYCISQSENEDVEIILSQIKIVTNKVDILTSYILNGENFE